MDNARVHKTQEVAEAVGSMGLNPIFLPPYSPQLNPIELVFGRLKTIYKSRSGIKL
jgi:transposase